MSEYHYSAEFASGARADLTLSRGGMQCQWTPDVPRLKGEAWQKFVATYQVWRDTCIADFAKRAGINVAVVDL